MEFNKFIFTFCFINFREILFNLVVIILSVNNLLRSLTNTDGGAAFKASEIFGHFFAQIGLKIFAYILGEYEIRIQLQK